MRARRRPLRHADSVRAGSDSEPKCRGRWPGWAERARLGSSAPTRCSLSFCQVGLASVGRPVQDDLLPRLKQIDDLVQRRARHVQRLRELVGYGRQHRHAMNRRRGNDRRLGVTGWEARPALTTSGSPGICTRSASFLTVRRAAGSTAHRRLPDRDNGAGEIVRPTCQSAVSRLYQSEGVLR